MLAVILCLAGIAFILAVSELLWRQGVLLGEHQRKFVHILSAIFIAAWPWLVSFKTIRLIGFAMVVGLLLNRRLKKLHYLGGIRQENYGDIFFAVAVIICTLLTSHKVFFATAMAELALADGLAALIGSQFSEKWSYKVFHQTKTLIGSMIFWLISLAVLGTGMLFTNGLIPMHHYQLALLIVPPILTLLENAAIMGLDDTAVPVAVVIMLQIAARS
jgi:dolichol kinase